MTDRELLEYAANAAGIVIDSIDAVHEPKDWVNWNPLQDDGDALRLAVKLRLHVQWAFTGLNKPEEVYATAKGMGHMYGNEVIGGNAEASTRRAIVRAAAEIGKAMESK